MAKKLDITTLSLEALSSLVSEKREELRTLRFSVAGSKNRNVKHASNLRRDIARALTQVTALKSK